MGLRRIGATDIAPILGLDPYRDAHDVWQLIVNGVEQPRNPRMLRGLKVEPVIRSIGVERYGLALEPRPEKSTPSKQYEFAAASPDDVALIEGVRCVGDYKSVSAWGAAKWGLEGTDEVVDHYNLQVRWQMAVMEIDHAFLLAAFGEDGKNEQGEDDFPINFTRLYRFERDLELEGGMLEAGRKFWVENVLAGVPPAKTLKKGRKQKQEAA